MAGRVLGVTIRGRLVSKIKGLSREEVLVLRAAEVTKSDASSRGLLQMGGKHAGTEIATISSSGEVKTTQSCQGQSRPQIERSALAAITGPHCGDSAEVNRREQTGAAGVPAKSRARVVAVEMDGAIRGRATGAGRMRRLLASAALGRTTGQIKGRLAMPPDRSGLPLASGRA